MAIGDVPNPGEHTRSILRGLGLSEMELGALEAGGVVATDPRVTDAAFA